MEDFEAPAQPEAKDTFMAKSTEAAKVPFEKWHDQKAPAWLPKLAVQLQAGWPGEGFEVTEAEYDAALAALLGTSIGYGKGGVR